MENTEEEKKKLNEWRSCGVKCGSEKYKESEKLKEEERTTRKI